MREAAYSYARRDGINYLELLASVTELDEETKRKHKEEQQIELRLIRNAQAITQSPKLSRPAFTARPFSREHASKASGISKPKITKALDDHTGGNWKSGHRWRLERRKNAKRYHLLTVSVSESTDTSYAHADF